GSIRNTWVRITVKANEHTGLGAPDVFFFGNLAGETVAESIRSARVNALDLAAVKQDMIAEFGKTVPITFRSDHNRDGRVNALDVAVVRGSLNAGFMYFTPRPTPAAASAPAAPASALLDDSRAMLA